MVMYFCRVSHGTARGREGTMTQLADAATHTDNRQVNGWDCDVEGKRKT